ncbi:hypothetical protein [Mycolicibacter arupensis]|uniref:Uncharacterized protein n=1 Tax=Mycolicibacter arupensis TaxID=342002 RepID=A0A0F5MXW0_9MYCO|nr:hypothetical protein [Mycolicibacter arupensis]KKB99600.1 hypothetical protein WR43_08850 [Mycolicibacter arupensis]MCV7274885.1 hypothetical protein [Mycolicibacter arupensis]OQZ93594.1 hypothetical protein BST15_17840 [Mycolicibacter arupensis]
MAFTVFYTRNGKVGYDSYDDDHIVGVHEAVIEVTKRGEQVKLYSPNCWDYVEPGEKLPTKPAMPSRIR